MSDIIENRVAKSPLQVFDLEDYYPEGTYKELDIKQWLHEGWVLREKDFRTEIENHSWEEYQDAYVGIYCSSDAIIPGWAFILVASKLNPFAKKVIQGTIDDVRSYLYADILSKIDYSIYQDKPVILKGCARKPVPENAYLMALEHLQKFAKSIMFGEACSAVPIFKKKKSSN